VVPSLTMYECPTMRLTLAATPFRTVGWALM
jgi:hypothetical protein